MQLNREKEKQFWLLVMLLSYTHLRGSQLSESKDCAMITYDS